MRRLLWPIVILLAIGVLLAALVSDRLAEWLFRGFSQLGDYCAYRDQWEGI